MADDKVLVLKKFYIQSSSNSNRTSIVWAADEEDAIQSVGGLDADEFVLNEPSWRTYQEHYANDDDLYQQQDYLESGWFAHLAHAAAPKVVISDRPEGWTDAFGLPCLRLKRFA